MSSATVLDGSAGRRSGRGRSHLRHRRHRRCAQADAAHPARLRMCLAASKKYPDRRDSHGLPGRHRLRAASSASRSSTSRSPVRHGDRIEARVHPAMVPRSTVRWPTSTVRSTPSSSTARRCVQHVRRPGRRHDADGDRGGRRSDGAGAQPAERLSRPGGAARPTAARPAADPPAASATAVRATFYLRFQVSDRPGVLAHIAGILARAQVSIASMIQREQRRRGTGDHRAANPPGRRVRPASRRSRDREAQCRARQGVVLRLEEPAF